MDVENKNQTGETYSLSVDFLSDEYLQKADEELNETSETGANLLRELKSFTKKDKATEDIDLHEDFLRQFLRQSKYDFQKAVKRLLAFVKFKRNNPKYYESVDSDQLSKTPDYKYCTPLPSRCQDGCTVTLFEIGVWDPSNISAEDLIRLGLLMCHQSLRNPMTQINGLKMICDWKDTGVRHLKYITPRTLYTSYQAFLNCTPVRIKTIHVVNESLPMKVCWTIFRPFLSTKMRNRCVFHSSPEELTNYFPKHVLPAKYGGDLENYYMGDWMKEANEQQKLATLAGQCNHF